MTAELSRWVMDTSTYTHFARAGCHSLLQALAPGGIVLIPSQVNSEIEGGRTNYDSIPSVRDTAWARLVVLDDEEEWTLLGVKADMGGTTTEHLGECAVIACARHRQLIAILDDRAAIVQAESRDVEWHDTLWIVVEAYKDLLGRDRTRAAGVIDNLLATGMKLPVDSGESFFSWAYVNGLLP